MNQDTINWLTVHLLPFEAEFRLRLRRVCTGAADVDDVIQEVYCNVMQMDDVAHVKDPRGYPEFFDALSRHDAKGSAHTMRNFQGGRPPLYEFESEIKRVTTPTLIIVGDEDDSCIESSLYLKKHISPSGLAMFPKTGHVLNLEETSQFNGAVERFIALAEAGRWGARDVRSIKS